MEVPFHRYPTAVRSENRYLASRLGKEFDHPRYQWAWSEDLVLPMIIIDNVGNIQYDYICNCGVNKTLHSVNCKFTVPKPKWEMRKLTMSLKDKWVLVKWRAPEASESDWASTFGGVPYPFGGYFIPVGTATQCIAIDAVPERATSQACADAISKHFSVKVKQHGQELKDEWKKREDDKREMYKIACKDAFPVHSGFPGEKEDWSSGGIGLSPVEQKFSADNTVKIERL